MNYRSYIGKILEVVIDRPIGSKHPKYGFEYPVNYGCVPNTEAGDGEEIDVYIIGAREPVDRIRGICIAVVHRKNDNEDKLILTPGGKVLSEAEIMSAISFQEQYFDSEIQFQEEEK